ncbi:MAG: threonine/serine exporter family protein, partial [Eubacteriales bacterium]
TREINLTVVSIVNDISRKFAAGKASLKEGLATVRNVSADSPRGPNILWISSAGSLASGAATILLGGSWADFAPAVVSTALVRLITGAAAFNLAYILQLYVAGLFSGLIGSLFVDFGFGQHLDKIIVGALLPLVPGVALTNAVRDFISGDLLSGTLRMAEALLIAVALAGGVGFALALYAGYIGTALENAGIF